MGVAGQQPVIEGFFSVAEVARKHLNSVVELELLEGELRPALHAIVLLLPEGVVAAQVVVTALAHALHL